MTRSEKKESNRAYSDPEGGAGRRRLAPAPSSKPVAISPPKRSDDRTKYEAHTERLPTDGEGDFEFIINCGIIVKGEGEWWLRVGEQPNMPFLRNISINGQRVLTREGVRIHPGDEIKGSDGRVFRFDPHRMEPRLEPISPWTTLKKTSLGWEFTPPPGVDVVVIDRKTRREKPPVEGTILLNEGDIIQQGDEGSGPHVLKQEFKDGRLPIYERPLSEPQPELAVAARKGWVPPPTQEVAPPKASLPLSEMKPAEEMVVSQNEKGELVPGETPGGRKLFIIRRGPRGFYLKVPEEGEDISFKQEENAVARPLGPGRQEPLKPGPLYIDAHDAITIPAAEGR